LAIILGFGQIFIKMLLLLSFFLFFFVDEHVVLKLMTVVVKSKQKNRLTHHLSRNLSKIPVKWSS